MTGSTRPTSLLRSVTLELDADTASMILALPREEIQRLIDRLVGEWSEHAPASAASARGEQSGTRALPLTEREIEVLTLIASGYTREEIGGALSISRNTAATHVAAIYRKLDIGSIAEATRFAIERGVLRLS